MDRLRVILVDDERLARAELKRSLAAYPGVVIVGEAADADHAEEQIVNLKPDAVFLDIRMPGRSGFDLLESLDAVPAVIFTTAFDQYAVQAFEANALDYLVKPVRKERLDKAIERLISKFDEKRTAGSQAPQTFFIKEKDRFYFVQETDISLIESVGNYARLHFKEQHGYIKRSLNLLEKMLNQVTFFRISRTQIVNLSYISHVTNLPRGKLTITLLDGRLLEVSSRQSAALRAKNIL